MFDRRQMLSGGLGLGAGLAAAAAGPRMAAAKPRSPSHIANVTAFGADPHSTQDQTLNLQHAIDQASIAKTPVFLPPGRYRTRELSLRDNTQIIGVPRQSVLHTAGESGLVLASSGRHIRMDGIDLTGGQSPLSPDGGADALLSFSAIEDFQIRNCRISGSKVNGISLKKCSGQISDTEVSDVHETGIYSEDAGHLEITHVFVHDCGNNGIQVWRSSQGGDGTFISMCRIEHIKAINGGTGQNGNGINIFRADEVMVTGNRITDCAFSAVRSNAGSNCQVIGNSCLRLGEVALYSEFGFEGAVIANNLVDQAATGVSITNFNEGGRLAIVQGNLIRNLRMRGSERGTGIGAEADTLVTGNVIENAPSFGLLLGWGRYLRDVTATNNIIRNARIGIGVSGNPQAGPAMITGNMISQAINGAIRATDHAQPVGPELAVNGAVNHSNLTVSGNVMA